MPSKWRSANRTLHLPVADSDDKVGMTWHPDLSQRHPRDVSLPFPAHFNQDAPGCGPPFAVVKTLPRLTQRPALKEAPALSSSILFIHRTSSVSGTIWRPSCCRGRALPWMASRKETSLFRYLKEECEASTVHWGCHSCYFIQTWPSLGTSIAKSCLEIDELHYKNNSTFTIKWQDGFK